MKRSLVWHSPQVCDEWEQEQIISILRRETSVRESDTSGKVVIHKRIMSRV